MELEQEVRELLRRMGQALNDKMGFDMFMLHPMFLHGFPDHCYCGKRYKYRGNLSRHWRQTKHWQYYEGFYA